MVPATGRSSARNSLPCAAPGFHSRRCARIISPPGCRWAATAHSGWRWRTRIAFAAGASLSGALDLNRRLREAGREGSRISRAEWIGIFGSKLRAQGTDSDLYFLAAHAAAAKGPRPALFLSCGTGDELLPDSRDFHVYLDRLDLAHVYEEHPGEHDWGYWDTHIQRVIEWLPLRT
jgi:S-formylglutathione hydrolase FrmB